MSSSRFAKGEPGKARVRLDNDLGRAESAANRAERERIAVDDLMPTPTESLTHMTELALPPHTNSHGTVFGGQVMSWIDVCGGIAAMRHCGSVAVTAAVDSLAFLAPVHLGNIVCLTARVNAAFTTSVEVEVVLDVEDPETRTTHRCVEAYLTFVSLGDDGPRQVPALIAESEAEKAREAAAHERRRDRLARRRKARTETNEGNNP